MEQGWSYYSNEKMCHHFTERVSACERIILGVDRPLIENPQNFPLCPVCQNLVEQNLLPGGTAHPRCRELSRHVCQIPSGNPCIEPGCARAAGTLWGPNWCPQCDVDRIDRVSGQLRGLAQSEPQPEIACFTIEITVHKDSEVGDAGPVQAKYHISGPDDVYWTNDPEDVPKIVRQALDWRG